MAIEPKTTIDTPNQPVRRKWHPAMRAIRWTLFFYVLLCTPVWTYLYRYGVGNLTGHPTFEAFANSEACKFGDVVSNLFRPPVRDQVLIDYVNEHQTALETLAQRVLYGGTMSVRDRDDGEFTRRAFPDAEQYMSTLNKLKLDGVYASSEWYENPYSIERQAQARICRDQRRRSPNSSPPPGCQFAKQMRTVHFVPVVAKEELSSPCKVVTRKRLEFFPGVPPNIRDFRIVPAYNQYPDTDDINTVRAQEVVQSTDWHVGSGRAGVLRPISPNWFIVRH